MNGIDSVSAQVLTILAQDNKTGFQISSGLRQLKIRLSDGELYPLLHTLEKNRLIRSRILTISPGLERRAYQLTSKGKGLLPKAHVPIPTPSAVTADPSSDKDLSMRIIRFRRWCADAVCDIRVSPDREIVSRELYDHMYDLFCHYLGEGTSPDEAESLTFGTMGSAKNIAQKLAPLHRPFWTLALRTTRWIMLVLAIITTYVYGLYLLDSHFFTPAPQDFDPDAGPIVSGEHSLILRLDPDCTAQSDGYTMHVDRADLWRSTDTDSSGSPRERQFMNIQIVCSNPLPWAESPNFQGWIWAVDSLGNYYYSAQEDSIALEPAISAASYQTGSLSYTLDLWIYNYVSQDAQWIELVYDRSGRDVVFHIDLTGGDAP